MRIHKQKARVAWSPFAEKHFLSDGFPRWINIIYRRHLNIYSRKHIYLSRARPTLCRRYISRRGGSVCVGIKHSFLRQRLSESTRPAATLGCDIDILKRFQSWWYIENGIINKSRRWKRVWPVAVKCLLSRAQRRYNLLYEFFLLYTDARRFHSTFLHTRALELNENISLYCGEEAA